MESLVSASSRTQLLFSPAGVLFNQAATHSLRYSLSFNYNYSAKPKHRTLSCKMSASKEVKLWGGRFEESVTDAVEKFTESISYDKALYKHDIMGSKAHASMLAKQVPAFFGFWPFFFNYLLLCFWYVGCLVDEKVREVRKKNGSERKIDLFVSLEGNGIISLVKALC